MNDPNRNEKLLRDVLSEGVDPIDAAAKARVLHVFERRHRAARLRPVFVVCTLALAGILFVSTRPDPAPMLPEQATIPQAVPETKKEPFLISDEELLAFFPSNSCSLANVDGKEMLVFWDDNVRRKLFHEPGVGAGAVRPADLSE
jgi:hypothetical protein